MKKNLAVLFASAALLAACGGDGGGDTAAAPAPTPAPPAAIVPPASINDSVANFIGYILALTAFTDSTTEPLDIAAVTPPVSETAEPMLLP